MPDGRQQDVAARLVRLRLDREAEVVALLPDVGAEQVHRLLVPVERRVHVLRATDSAPSRPPQSTYVVAPSSAARSTLRSTFASAYRRTSRSLAVRPPSLKTGWLNRFVVAISTTTPVSASALVNRSSTCWRRLSSGTRSSSWKDTAAAPSSASFSTARTGSSGARTAVPKTSTPSQPTVHRPKENLSSFVGV